MSEPFRGRALVINVYNFGRYGNRREGSDTDSSNIRKLLQGLGFIIALPASLTAQVVMF